MSHVELAMEQLALPSTNMHKTKALAITDLKEAAFSNFTNLSSMVYLLYTKVFMLVNYRKYFTIYVESRKEDKPLCA